MNLDLPQYLLFAEASRNRRTMHTWRFVLQNLGDQSRFTASDQEETATIERLELLAVVRGLEALEGPAQVTLVTKSRYVCRGFRFGLEQWRDNNWRWERFGRNVSIRDHDLWQRVDRALEFHQVVCQLWHFEQTEGDEEMRESKVAWEEPDWALPAIVPETRHASNPRFSRNQRMNRIMPQEVRRSWKHLEEASA